MNTSETVTTPGAQEPAKKPPESGSQEPPLSSQEPGPAQKRLNEAEQAEAVAALFDGEPEQAQQQPPGGDDDAIIWDDDPKPGEQEPKAAAAAKAGMTVSDMAQSLGVEPEMLYGMKIPIGDGEAISLGKLKDAHANREQVSRESADREATLNSREADIVADQQVWSVLAAKGQVPAAAIDAAKRELAKVVSRETDMLYKLVPDLQDATKLDGFRRDMVRVLGGVGYKPHEVSLTDHRQALFVRRFLQLERENKAMRKQTRAKAPRSQPAQGRSQAGKNSRSTPMKSAKRHSETAKVEAVGRLLNGG